jgi:hypothetical protein
MHQASAGGPPVNSSEVSDLLVTNAELDAGAEVAFVLESANGAVDRDGCVLAFAL